MGMIVYVYRTAEGDASNGGVSARHNTLTVVNVDGPFTPTENRPAAYLTTGPLGHPILVPADEVNGTYAPRKTGFSEVGPMFGGNIADTSDARWNRAVRKIAGVSGPVHIHDRFEVRH